MNTVFLAEAYKPNNMGSFGNANNMLIRQHNFPYKYTDKDRIYSAYSDRCFQWNYSHARSMLEKHNVGGELNIGNWAKSAWPKDVIAFLKDFLKVSEDVELSGFRILGSVHRGNGYPVFFLELFYKHPDSATKVYSGHDAPNVERSNNTISSYEYFR